MFLTFQRSRAFRATVGAVAVVSMLAGLASTAEARPRRPGYAYGGRPIAPPRRHHGGGNAAAFAAIAGIAALGIGAAIASSQSRRTYQTYEDPYGPDYAYEPAPEEPVTLYEEPGYAPPVRRPPPPPPMYSQPMPRGWGHHAPQWREPHHPGGPHISRADWHRLRIQQERERR
ncbi:hypothetical protein SLNSH_22035 [Alsobacter soli]|uniref:Uncharacterized protein n=1 Tax=Alsobacter soli TaxID=2109933 RepID=A0A2T1HMB8_9HYPH|nr:hypothetical protein [Alsobacter soli]PSC02805.1 hypothetical protein SLNSH_22035 [Alsobacter soli]